VARECPFTNASRIGDVVFIAPDGPFNAAPATSADEYDWALVDPGVYAVLVMSYVQTNLPLQLRMELGPSK